MCFVRIFCSFVLLLCHFSRVFYVVSQFAYHSISFQIYMFVLRYWWSSAEDKVILALGLEEEKEVLVEV